MNLPISPLHQELLDPKRQEIFKKLVTFRDFGILAGGTALMLQIGHRRSFDFDIFLNQELPENLLSKVNKVFASSLIIPSVNTRENLTLTIDSVVVTFFNYPFAPLHPVISTQSLSLFSVADIASNKAHTIGRRPAWRDYVDIYFLLRDHTNLSKVISDASARFAGNFAEKLFLEQLTYFDDISSYTMELVDKSVTEDQIKKFLETCVRKYLREMKVVA